MSLTAGSSARHLDDSQNNSDQDEVWTLGRMRRSTNETRNPRSPHLESNTRRGLTAANVRGSDAHPICTWMHTGWAGSCCVSGALGVHVCTVREMAACQKLVDERYESIFLHHVPESGQYEAHTT